ncbi:nitrous oxide reductase accessory protein NosL [uncultured Pontibacter sp.]|uniref:nitrous oxide reductase accessory protein NosL n=1 Tax=uncultured Pontibacter sp. TaxID=453356 RepID=UPI0026191EF2|nr:nitrous oxide reductase accessory protein NosL [uncultured Pontibacter sp.]
MKLLKSIATLTFLAVLSACSVEPKPIPYGEANCTHCNMTVSDNRFGAELVNDKGKPFYFDAAECLAAYLVKQPELQQSASFVMVTDYTNPGNLVDAKNAHFLQSEAIQSPMGMNLTAFADELTAKQMEQEHGGRILTWDQVQSAVKNDTKFQR